MKYIIRDREAGNVIDEFDTMAEAKKELEAFEAQDKKDGTFTEDFYEIVEKGYYRVTREVAEAMNKKGLEDNLRNGRYNAERVLITDDKEEAEKRAKELNRGEYTERGFYGTIYRSEIAYVEEAEEWEIEEFQEAQD